MGTEFLKIKESEDALEIIQNLFDKYYTLQSEEIAVEDAYGRVLSGDVYSRMDFPPFDKALKDGFAILSQDSFGASEESPKTLEVIDFLEAGSTTDKIVEEGKCVEISTGAAMPEGADAVVMVEYCEKMDSAVNILTTVTPTQDVAKKGSDTEESKLILKKGDVLIKVGNYKVKTSDALDDIVKKIKGAEGTKVNLTFTRNQTTKTYTFTRQSIENPTVETKMLKDQIGYLQVTEFDEVTVSQFKSGLASLKKQGAKKLIIDLRDNPGGLLTSVVDIASQILPKGTIVYTEDKNGNKKYYKDTKNEQLDMPLCVLVNGNSASAAEILSGAVKDRNTGTLVGETTFGKGIVQGFFEVGDGSYVKLTYSSYYTPAGHNIHKKGIKPDVEVKDNTKTKADEQLDKAISILQKK